MDKLINFTLARFAAIYEWLEEPVSEKKRLKQAIKAVEAENRGLRRDVAELAEFAQTERNHILDLEEVLEDTWMLLADLQIDIAQVAYKLEQSKSANYHKIAAEIRTVLDQY